MSTNGNQWGANGKAVEKCKRYVLEFMINGNPMFNHWKYFSVYLFRFNSNGSSNPYHWEYSNVTYYHSSFNGVQWHITDKTLVVLISI